MSSTENVVTDKENKDGWLSRVHGDSLLVTRGRNTKMMKIIIIACLAAVAFAEPEAKPKADPYLLYGGHLGYAGYGGYYGHGLGYSYYGKRGADAEPKADADPYLLYGGYGLGHLGYSTGYYGHHLGYSHYYGKREAEPKADPYLL